MDKKTILDSLFRVREAERSRYEAARKTLEDAEKGKEVIERLCDYCDKGHHASILRTYHTEAKFIDAFKNMYPDCAYAVDALHADAKTGFSDLKNLFPSRIDKECEKSGIHLDRTSRHPRYTLKNGFLSLTVDENRHEAKLGTRESVLETIGMDIPLIVSSLSAHCQRLFGRKKDNKRFIRQLLRQYQAVIKKEKKGEGDSVSIRSITRRLGKNLKGFRVDEFAVDLSNLVTEGPTEIDGYVLDLSHTRDERQGMFLLGHEGRGAIGFIRFFKGGRNA